MSDKIALNQYTDFAKSIWLSGNDDMGLAIATIGMAGETGEVAEKIKKNLMGNKVADTYSNDVVKELGDVLYYLTMVAVLHGFTLADVAKVNMEKLSARVAAGTLRGNGDNR